MRRVSGRRRESGRRGRGRGAGRHNRRHGSGEGEDRRRRTEVGGRGTGDGGREAINQWDCLGKAREGPVWGLRCACAPVWFRAALEERCGTPSSAGASLTACAACTAARQGRNRAKGARGGGEGREEEGGSSRALDSACSARARCRIAANNQNKESALLWCQRTWTRDCAQTIPGRDRKMGMMAREAIRMCHPVRACGESVGVVGGCGRGGAWRSGLPGARAVLLEWDGPAGGSRSVTGCLKYRIGTEHLSDWRRQIMTTRALGIQGPAHPATGTEPGRLDEGKICLGLKTDQHKVEK